MLYIWFLEHCKNQVATLRPLVSTAPWPFSVWGMDVIRPVILNASNGHEYILVAINYFTKWVEDASYKSVTQAVVVRFLKQYIIYHYVVPGELIINNGKNLNGKMIKQLCQQFKIRHCNSVPYRLQINGAVEAVNKNIKKILVKMTNTYKDWHKFLPFTLYAYCTSVHTSIDATSYSLVYDMEAVLPAQVEIPSLRILSQTKLLKAEWAHSQYEKVNKIDEKCMTTMCHGQLYQRCVEREFNKKVRPRVFEEGNLVLKKCNQAILDHRRKFSPTYEGPFVVKKAFSRGVLILADMDGHDFNMPTNFDAVIQYFT